MVGPGGPPITSVCPSKGFFSAATAAAGSMPALSALDCHKAAPATAPAAPVADAKNCLRLTTRPDLPSPIAGPPCLLQDLSQLCWLFETVPIVLLTAQKSTPGSLGK